MIFFAFITHVVLIDDDKAETNNQWLKSR